MRVQISSGPPLQKRRKTMFDYDFYARRFIKQYTEIEYYKVILHGTRKSEEWFERQKEIPYLPKIDIFAYYCPICNNILQFRNSCNNCKQLIYWLDGMERKIIE